MIMLGLDRCLPCHRADNVSAFRASGAITPKFGIFFAENSHEAL